MVEINEIIQFGKDLWKLSHLTPLTPRTTLKLDQVGQGLVWLSPWRRCTASLASCASAGLTSPWKILPITTGWNCPCCILPLLALFLLLCILRRLALPLLFSPIRKLKSAIQCPPPWPSLPETEHEQVSAFWYIILQLPYHPPAPSWPEWPQYHNICLAAGQKGPLLILQMWVKFSFASVSYYSAVFSRKQVYNLQFSLSICKPRGIFPSSMAG